MNTTSSAERPGLVRALGPWMAIAVVVGTVIGSGVFRKASSIAQDVDSFGLAALAWVLGGVLALLGSLAYAEVSVLYPRSGGSYVLLREAYGRLAGFLWGWADLCIMRTASLAALATAFIDSLHDIWGETTDTEIGFWQLKGLTVAVIVGLAVINVRGVTWGGGLQVVVTTVKVASLVGILLLPWLAPLLVGAGTTPRPPDPENLRPLWPDNWGLEVWTGLGAALVGVMWAYNGWMNLASVAEEVKEPRRNLPLALLGGVGLIIVLYLGANLAYSLVLTHGELKLEGNEVTVAAFGRVLLGQAGLVAASAVMMCSTFGALSGNLLVGPRLLYAMGEDRLAPRVLSEVHPRYRTPAVAILAMAAWASLLVLGVGVLNLVGMLDPKKKPFDVLTDFAIFGVGIFETLSVSTIFVFRRRFPEVERPYRCPGYPLVPALYILIVSLVLASMFWNKPDEARIGLGIIAVGGLVYGLFLRRPAA